MKYWIVLPIDTDLELVTVPLTVPYVVRAATREEAAEIARLSKWKAFALLEAEPG